MHIQYKNRGLEQVCTVAHRAQREYGERMAERIYQRIGEIIAAPSLEFMLQYGIGGCHALAGNRKGQYAMNLVHPFRLIFMVKNNGVQIAFITEIVDYH